MPNELWYWEKRVPEDLIDAVKHIRDLFEEARWKSGTVTQHCCYAALHPELRPPDEHGEYVSALTTLESYFGPHTAKYFHDLLSRRTPSAILAAFFHFYKEAMAIQVKGAFRHLLEIGSANAERLDTAPIGWADWHGKSIINSASYQTGLWLRRCCDLESFDLDFDLTAGEEEEHVWTNWRAPRFVSMQPSLGLPYVALLALEREDVESSRKVVKAFKETFVNHLEAQLKDCVGSAQLELAKQPSAVPKASTGGGSQQQTTPVAASANSRPKSRMNYTSEIKRAIQVELTRKPSATDLDICRALDGSGSAELPKTWQPKPGDREFEKAYIEKRTRPRIEKTISKVRADMREAQLLPLP